MQTFSTWIATVLIVILCAACSATDEIAAVASTGEQLARNYCGSCHQVPNTDVLPADTWPVLLDLMGLYFGYDDGAMLSSTTDADLLRQTWDLDRYPDTPLISNEDWAAIRTYYESSAGSGPVAPPPAAEPLTMFEHEPFSFGDAAPIVSLVHVKTGGGLYLGDARAELIGSVSANGQNSVSLVPGVPVHIDIAESGAERLTLIGSLAPSNAANGAIAVRSTMDEDWSLMAEDLHRPVHSLYADLDNDGDEDFLVCEFGHYVGSLSLFERTDGGELKKHILNPESGAVMARLVQSNSDGPPDVLVLNAQAREGIVLMRNRGNLKFDQDVLLESHPGFGYTDMHLADLDGDGNDEILTINGDNGDLPGPPLKAYHGLRIYRMHGDGALDELLFLPMQGAFRAAPGDFDNDGDVDIAAISFFPDPRAAEQAFVYFENEGDMRFSRKTMGRAILAPWITIAAGDADNDGDMDILLGTGYVGVADQENPPAAILLRNKTRQ